MEYRFSAEAYITGPGNIPLAQCGIVRSRNRTPTITGYRYSLNPIGVIFKDHTVLDHDTFKFILATTPRFSFFWDIPYPYCTIMRYRNQPLSIWSGSDSVYFSQVTDQPVLWVACPYIKDMDDMVIPGRCDLQSIHHDKNIIQLAMRVLE
jgi:hypothetical protein